MEKRVVDASDTPWVMGQHTLQYLLHLGNKVRVAKLACADVHGQHQLVGQWVAFPEFEL